MVNGCNSVLGGLMKVEWIDLAWEVYDEVVKSGVELNSFTINIMVNVFCKEGNFDKVEDFLVGFEGRSVVTYNTLIHGYSRVGRIDEAFEVLKSMPIKGFEPYPKQTARTKVMAGIRFVVATANVADDKDKAFTYKFCANEPLQYKEQHNKTYDLKKHIIFGKTKI
ncbi:Pentatricopeptide repeat-containing protein [Artemisia annua]|uniref:Pentatricopeptide repeat-containing protein n=1 Tax=Artemisia annua TaxID=35608 RepID=A0A2U1QGM3_ARTAN|nr:Pentatricopeptide repeat-containing protein [Artemisia annua]